MKLSSSLLMVGLVAGCAKKRDPAPTEMVDLARFVFQNWEDEEALPDAVDNLQAWLADNIDTDEAHDGFRLEPLDPADVADVNHPDVPLSGLLGAAGAAPSAFSLDDHSGEITEEDQVFANPGTYDRYERSFVGGDPERFRKGTDLLRTSNDIETSTLGITIDYTLLKDYRWVEGETAEAIVARSWTEEEYCNDGGGTCLEQTYSVDLFFEHQGATWRMTAAWNQLDSSLPIGEDLMVATLAIGIQNVFKYTDEYLAGTENLD